MDMFKKVLIANRGEIAVRIIQACHEMDIQTVAVFSEVDRESLHVKLADEAYCIGPAPAQQSYLNIEHILKVATLANVDAIHPGYGFLAENKRFANLCEDIGITFIGPSAEAIEQMGMKDVARQMMKKANIPIVPGSDGAIKNTEEAISIAKEIGFPVMIKATAGGGGKGIRVVYNVEELKQGIELTQQEAMKAFGNDGVYLEKYIDKFRHVEIQIIADQNGHTIHLGERDCTIQRRMQKLIEETPSPVISQEMREKMGNDAVKAAQSIQYVGVGTVEFIFDHIHNKYYFMEMNTRIQVEHPITEMVTGIDLVREQLKIASGQPLQLTQADIQLNGSSIECRINAEDPLNNFIPTPGKINTYIAPGGLGVRVDTAVYEGYTIQPFYDPLIAKVIVHGNSREQAILKMQRALDHFQIEDIKTTIPFLSHILRDDDFINASFDNHYLKAKDFIKN